MPATVEGKDGSKNKRGLSGRLKSFLHNIIAERLDPWHVFAAVFIGIFVGVVPIYGLQSLTAIGLATLFRLNKPITFGATFINNPLLQPLLIFYSIVLGHYMLHGERLHLASFQIRNMDLRSQLSDWVVGSLILGLILGLAGASFAALFVYSRSPHSAGRKAGVRMASRFVRELFKSSPHFARGFVRWKLRLDNIFALLLMEVDGRTSAVDLGCGYGIALAVAAFRNPGLRLIGCDLDRNRIRIATRALSSLRAQLFVHDIRTFEFTGTSLIMIMDVLQYLNAQEQCSLLKKCCAALEPGGKLIFRVPDKEHGMLSAATMALDRIIFRFTGMRKQPAVLPSEEYEKVLKDARMILRKQRLMSRLPLAHIVFIAEKPAEAGAVIILS